MTPEDLTLLEEAEKVAAAFDKLHIGARHVVRQLAARLSEVLAHVEQVQQECPWCGDGVRTVLKPSGGCLIAEVNGREWHPQCADEKEALEAAEAENRSLRALLEKAAEFMANADYGDWWEQQSKPLYAAITASLLEKEPPQ